MSDPHATDTAAPAKNEDSHGAQREPFVVHTLGDASRRDYVPHVDNATLARLVVLSAHRGRASRTLPRNVVVALAVTDGWAGLIRRQYDRDPATIADLWTADGTLVLAATSPAEGSA